MQEIAYREILKKNRRQYHHEVGIAIEKLYRNNLSQQSSFLAYHFYLARDWQKALAYTLEAGDQAKRSFACGEALMCFDRALNILQKGKWEHAGERSLQLYKWKGGMQFCLGQLKESHRTFQRCWWKRPKSKTAKPREKPSFEWVGRLFSITIPFQH